ncbi:MAG: hypothetical protein ACKOIZ_09950, partial [Actinomycetota bacterium]
MSYVLAIITFLVGAALGVSVARRRVERNATNAATQTRETAAAPASGERGAVAATTAQPAAVDDIIVAALDALPSGVVIAESNGSIMFKNAAARA